ncbi:hypothetical protein GCM10007301_49400 [Azorhizobium oxalatiphilum]|uniref:MipA/OmpV family protein n=1 Tax=Azorhizobium oxalatiphilum TaxID=980631 RepID=A0A917CC76_9HYPH|nr:MipA/OmpV family protein [Azorhizobium oxalatiphilum]GGF83450.1 hypothetical protein GCM10007301_49400 [Azorhizobium oxalatiphilum]
MARTLSMSSVALVAFLGLGAQGALAADFAYKASPQPAMTGTTEDWYLTIGASAKVVPDYPGSDDYGFAPGFIFRISKASGLNVFRSVDDNPSIALFDTGRFRIGAVGRLDWGRDEDDSDRLRGLGDVDMSVELGGFAEWYAMDWLRLRGELRYGFGGFSGLMGDLAADVIVPYESWRFAVGPRLKFASSGYMQEYFGVTPWQSFSATYLLNPLPIYNAGGGVQSWGATAQLTKNFGNGYEAGVFASYNRLVGDAADSPLTDSANQFTAGMSLSYTFNMGKAWW